MSMALSKELRNLLARVTMAARELAEQGARAALENLAVHEKDYRPHMTVDQRQLRNRLRARGRALGDPRDERSGTQRITRLMEDVAYEQWHRLLFTLFLAENHLLHTDEANGSVPVTLKECEELAPALGARDGFDLACRFASNTLPGVFRPQDPVLDLRMAPNDEVELRRLLDSLPSEVFRSDDALGWTYQFWQAKRKDDVNKSGVKIGAEELPAVTQLFTEDYMVEFLLHNTLGAWWAGKLGPIVAATEEQARSKVALGTKDGIAARWTYLRFMRGQEGETWSPAAGVFSGWPQEARLIKFLDPCMGSGHFVVSALPLIARLRMEEEGLSGEQAIHATLRDNLFNLELDERCTQIAAFNVALAAWKLGGWRPLPPLNLACSGLAPHASEKTWVALGGSNDRLRRGMVRLYALFKDAPVLGSLIDPRSAGGNLIEAEFHELQPLLAKALEAEKNSDEDRAELSVVARGLAKAAEILAGQFTLVATNVPYLKREKHGAALGAFVDLNYPAGKADLATAFVERCVSLCHASGTLAVVSPYHWLFQTNYRNVRRALLNQGAWNLVAVLGEHAFSSPQAAGAFVAMCVLTKALPRADQVFAVLNGVKAERPIEKAAAVLVGALALRSQAKILKTPDAAIPLEDIGEELVLFGNVASCFQGTSTGDNSRLVACFWEIPNIRDGWDVFLVPPETPTNYGGREHIVRWALIDQGICLAAVRGHNAWGQKGVAIGKMRSLPATLYLGEKFSNTAPVIIPKKQEHLSAVWQFCVSGEFTKALRAINPGVAVENGYVAKIHWNPEYWLSRAEAEPVPGPHSDDSRQWLFGGTPRGSVQPLHVAVARLLGYRWPRQTGSGFPDCGAPDPDGIEPHADADGVVCLMALNREQPAAARLRALLAAALGSCDERSLIANTGSSKRTLEEWLRDEFFEQHCDLFHQRPFVWHIWDGRKDGFQALVNYHRLDQPGLKKLTYSYLGDWIRQQDGDAKADRPGAAERLSAAQALQAELVKILEGEPPYDIFVRWKPLAEQPLGWDPNLNDGVRLNIRPFLKAQDLGKKDAGVLRVKPNIKWDKDRGKEPHHKKADFPWLWCEGEPGTDPEGDKAFVGHRWNSTHLTLALKRAARAKG